MALEKHVLQNVWPQGVVTACRWTLMAAGIVSTAGCHRQGEQHATFQPAFQPAGHSLSAAPTAAADLAQRAVSCTKCIQRRPPAGAASYRPGKQHRRSPLFPLQASFQALHNRHAHSPHPHLPPPAVPPRSVAAHASTPPPPPLLLGPPLPPPPPPPPSDSTSCSSCNAASSCSWVGWAANPLL